MPGIKYKYSLKAYEITRKMARHILAYKIWQRKARCTIPYNTPYNINHSLATLNADNMFEPTEEGD